MVALEDSPKPNTLVYTRGVTRGAINTIQRRLEIQCLTNQGVTIAAATQFINDKVINLQTRLQRG